MFRTIIFVFLLVTLSCVLASLALADWWHQPLGEPLAIPALTEAATGIPQGDAEALVSDTVEPPTLTITPAEEDAQPTATAQPTDTPTPTQVTATTTETALPNTPEPIDESSKPLYILVAGIASTDEQYRFGLADAIRIVRVDFETPKVTVLTLPRDLWVELPGIKPEFDTLTHGKLNTAYSYGTPAFNRYEGEGGGPGLLAHTIAHNYGLVVDHYAIVNMAVFSDIVDAVGGIDIYLDRTWDGRADTDNPDHMAWVFEEGQHHMKGEDALRFARIRLNYSEVVRTDNQTLVMCAVREKMLRPQVLTAIPEIAKAFLGRVQTDLSPAQISQLVMLLPEVGASNLLFVRFPNNMMVPGRVFDPSLNNTTFFWDIPNEDIRSFIQAFQQDNISIEIGGGAGRTCP